MTDKRSRTLTRQEVIATALRIVDRDGADALTMRALGRELGVDPMATYNHVPNKSAVLDGIVEAVWGELELPDSDSLDWQQQLEAIARSMRATLLRHPNALQIVATRPNRAEPGFRLVEATLSPLLEAGVEPLEALSFINAAASFIIGSALAEAGAMHDDTPATDTPAADGDPEVDDLPEAGDDDLLVTLQRTVSATDHPHLARTLAEAELDRLSGEHIFETGIRALVGGVEALRSDSGVGS